MSHKAHDHYFEQAAVQARQAKCHRAHCGAVVVTEDGKIIGAGYNAPPNDDENQRYCDTTFNFEIKPKYDKTCCVHAEWNAIINALKNFGDKINGGTLYFMRVDEKGAWTDAGAPFCTVCSRLAAQSGLKYFALWVNDKPKIYEVSDYNRESYKFYLSNKKRDAK
jgi:hypothetical protein